MALLTTIGLSSKNAILIVEFAGSGGCRGLFLESCGITRGADSFTPNHHDLAGVYCGVMPLAIATGAGANSRIAIGTGIIGGTLTATLLAIFFVPLFLYW